MAWGKAGSTTKSSAGTGLSISSLTTSNTNLVLTHQLSSTNVSPEYRLDSNSNTDYAYRKSNNGGADGTVTSDNNAQIDSNGGNNDKFVIIYFSNVDGDEKLAISFLVDRNTAGAGTAPNRTEGVSKVDTTTNTGQFTAIDVETGGSAIGADSNLSVLGSDITPAAAVPALGANIQVGSRYEETDTRKMYNLGSVSKSGCLEYYNFEQTSGSLTNIATTANGFNDGLGSSGDGTNVGATTAIAGKVGSYAWEFDNTAHTTGDRVTLGGTSTIGTLSTGTISAWIKNDAPSRAAQHMIFSASDSGDASSEFGWGVLSDQLYLIARENGSLIVPHFYAGTINSGTWYHAVITFDSTGTEMFLDGQSVGTTSSVSPSSVNNVDLITLGSNVDSSGAQWGFDGLIDEVSIWNRVLTDNEISVLYNSGTGTPIDNAKAWQEIGT